MEHCRYQQTEKGILHFFELFFFSTLALHCQGSYAHMGESVSILIGKKQTGEEKKCRAFPQLFE